MAKPKEKMMHPKFRVAWFENGKVKVEDFTHRRDMEDLVGMLLESGIPMDNILTGGYSKPYENRFCSPAPAKK